MLSTTDLATFRDQGYLVVKDFASPSECEALRDRAAAMVNAFEPLQDQRSVFNLSDPQRKHQNSRYFINSLNAAACFFQSSFVDSDGITRSSKYDTIVKIGHALHDYDPIFQAFSHSRRIQDTVATLGYKRPLIGQSRYFFKLPWIKDQTLGHQDSMVLYTEPLSCNALWIALEDATVYNSCLWVVPGSNKEGLVARVTKNDANEGQVVRLRNLPEWDDGEYIPLEVQAGTAVLLGGEVAHRCYQNVSNRSRQAYSLHFIEGDASCYVPKDNWLQRPGGFRPLLKKTELEDTCDENSEVHIF